MVGRIFAVTCQHADDGKPTGKDRELSPSRLAKGCCSAPRPYSGIARKYAGQRERTDGFVFPLSVLFVRTRKTHPVGSEVGGQPG